MSNEDHPSVTPPDHFTWDDVEGLRSLADSLSQNISASVSPLEDLADRIEALLPPRE